MKKIIIKKGERYGILTIIKEVQSTFTLKKKKMRRVLCLCDCGKEVTVFFCNVRKIGHTTSCGCVRTKRIVKFIKENGPTNIKHGMCGTPEYVTWNSIKNHAQKDICLSWLNFEGFFNDMGKRPEGTVLIRIDLEKGFEPSNCKWDKMGSNSRKGKESPCWIKDRTQLKKSDRNSKSPACMDWKKNVYKRDGWKCKINNSDCEGRIEAHHILPWIDFLKLRYEINNGITLCHAHHPRKRSEVAKLSPYFKQLVAET